MNKAEASKIAESFFKGYPKIDKFNVTTDGQVFEDKKDADAHAYSLDKKEPTVFEIERGEAKQAVNKAEQSNVAENTEEITEKKTSKKK